MFDLYQNYIIAKNQILSQYPLHIQQRYFEEGNQIRRFSSTSNMNPFPVIDQMGTVHIDQGITLSQQRIPENIPENIAGTVGTKNKTDREGNIVPNQVNLPQRLQQDYNFDLEQVSLGETEE